MTRIRKTEQPAEPQPAEPQATIQPARPLSFEDRIKAKIVDLEEKEAKTKDEYATYQQQVNAQMGYFQGKLAEMVVQKETLRELLIPEGSDPDTNGDGANRELRRIAAARRG
jgi:hypothetical protein